MEYKIRELKTSEYYLLNEFIYEAIFQNDLQSMLPRTVIQAKELQQYTKDFGSLKDDFAMCAEVDGKVIGAVWVRNINGYGSIDKVSPEFVISLYKEYRNQGIGTELAKALINQLTGKGYKKLTLIVQGKNEHAIKVFENIGFDRLAATREEYIYTYFF